MTIATPARRRGVLGACAVLLVALVALGAAVAPPRAEATPSPESGSLLVILDMSGSMARPDGAGATLVQGARRAVRALLADLPGETPVGLRLYGSTYPGNDEARGCRDTELAVPIGPASQTAPRINRAMGAASPTGFTPIGRALTAAAGDFGPEGARSIVLVSDGEDTCGDPDPCAAARSLAAQGIAVRVDTVGLALEDRRAERQLRCIADATDGTYVAAANAAELTAELTAASTRAVRRFQVAGTQVEGGTSQASATPVEPGAPFSDDILGGEARWYAFDVEEGQDVAITVTDDGTVDYGCCLTVRLRDPAGDQVSFSNDFNTSGVAQTQNLRSSPDGARESGRHYLSVELTDADATTPVPYEVAIEVTGEPAAPTESASPTPTAEPSEEASADADPAAAPAGDGGSVPTWIYVVLALLTLAVLGLGATVVRLLSAARR